MKWAMAEVSLLFTYTASWDALQAELCPDFAQQYECLAPDGRLKL